MEYYIIGTIAAILTTFGFVPQIIKIYRTKSAKDVSIVTLFQFSIGTFLWTLYGLHIQDPIIITANIVTFVTVIIAIVLYYHYIKIQLLIL